MKDISTPLISAYYQKLNGNVTNPSGGIVKVFEGEEPDNLLDDAYIVIQDINATDTSPKSLNQHNATVLITINTHKGKFNSRKNLNEISGQIITLIKPTPASTMQADGIDIVSTSMDQNDINYGYLANRVFVSRNLIFSHLISY